MVRAKSICILLLLFCLLWVPCTGLAYQISEGELTQLEQNLTALSKINQQLSSDLNQSKKDLQTLQTKLEIVEKQLLSLSAESNLAKNSLDQANKSLEIASKSFKRLETEANRVKFQRNLLFIAVGYLALR